MKAFNHRRTIPSQQRGIASVAIAILLLFFMGLAILGAATLSTGTTRDAVEEYARVNALFLAESGIERAIYRYDNGTACNNGTTDALAETVSVIGRGSVTISSFNTSFSGTTLSSNCRIRAVATTSGGSSADVVVRTLETAAIQNTALHTAGNRKFNCTVPSGTNRGLVVGVSWTKAGANIDVTGISFSSAAMTQIGSTVSTTSGSTRYRTALFYLADPSVGDDLLGSLTMTDDPDGVVFACMNFQGVTAPTFSGSCTSTSPTVIDTFSTSQTGSGSAIAIPMTPRSACTGTRYLVASVGRNNGGNPAVNTDTATACPSTSVDVYGSNANNDTGNFTVCGQVDNTTLPATIANFGWTGNQNKPWAGAGLVIYASSYVTQAQNTAGGKAAAATTSSGGGGVTGWREIIVPPP